LGVFRRRKRVSKGVGKRLIGVKMTREITSWCQSGPENDNLVSRLTGKLKLVSVEGRLDVVDKA
jgi:hypothetical protein